MVRSVEGIFQIPFVAIVHEQWHSVVEAVKRIFQRIIDAIVFIWNGVAVNTFLFFRTFDFVSPDLSGKIERAWLYAMNSWDNFLAKSREGELIAANTDLTARNEDLTSQNEEQSARIQQLESEKEDVCIQVREQAGQIQALTRENEMLKQDKKFAHQQLAPLREQVDALQVQLAALRAQLAALEGKGPNTSDGSLSTLTASLSPEFRELLEQIMRQP